MVRRRAQKWKFKLFRKIVYSIFKNMLKSIPFGITFGVVCFIFFGVRQMLHADPYFQVERITVFPSGLLASSEYQFLDSQVRGRSLFEVNLKDISRSLERNPKIKRAEIVRILPNQLNVFLATRSPFVQVQLREGGSYYLVASDQLIVSTQDSPKPDLVILEDFNSEKRNYSVGAFYPNKHFRSLFGIFEAMKKDPVLNLETISKLTMDQLGDITLVLNDGVELKTNGEIVLTQKMREVLHSLLKSENRNQILYVDLRYRDLIVKRKS